MYGLNWLVEFEEQFIRVKASMRKNKKIVFGVTKGNLTKALTFYV